MRVLPVNNNNRPTSLIDIYAHIIRTSMRSYTKDPPSKASALANERWRLFLPTRLALNLRVCTKWFRFYYYYNNNNKSSSELRTLPPIHSFLFLCAVLLHSLWTLSPFPFLFMWCDKKTLICPQKRKRRKNNLWVTYPASFHNY